jgi:TolB protein
MHATTLHWRRLKSVGVFMLVGVAASGTGLVPRAEASVSDPTGTIAFTWATPSFSVEEIGTIHADGSNRNDLTNEEGFDAMAAYSPDGRRIAFSSTRSMPPGFQGDPRLFSEVYVMDADGSNVERVTFNEGLLDFWASWSPDGRRIVVTRGSGATPPPDAFILPTDLWIIDLATGREHQLTNSPSTYEWMAHWSPDGRRIAFAGDLVEPGNHDVYTIRVDGRNLRRLTSTPDFDRDPHYSPHGRSIAFTSNRTGNFDVFVMRKNGTNIRQLTDHPGGDGSPCYSPDGQFIAFNSDRDGTDDIFRMRADGTQQTNLTRSPMLNEFDCNWQRR